jgi:hypothetical protein
MFWCYCGHSIKNVKVPVNIEKKIISDEIIVKKIEEEVVIKIEDVKINTDDKIDIQRIENNIIERPFENFNENDPYRQKIVRTIKMFLNKVM